MSLHLGASCGGAETTPWPRWCQRRAALSPRSASPRSCGTPLAVPRPPQIEASSTRCAGRHRSRVSYSGESVAEPSC